MKRRLIHFRIPIVVPVLWFLGAMPHAVAQTSGGPSVSRDIAVQKARMIEAFLISERVRRVEAEKADGVVPLLDAARAELEAGEAALNQSQVAEAIVHFDASLRALSEAVSLAAKSGTAAVDTTEQQKARIASYLEVLGRSNELGIAERSQLEDLLDRFRDISEGAGTESQVALSRLFDDTVELTSRITRGRTVLVRKVFETAEDEYEYEVRRNDGYKLLVRIAVEERSLEQPGLKKLAETLVNDSDRLRGEAADRAQSGDHPEAIRLVQLATARLGVALRSAGVLTMGEQ